MPGRRPRPIKKATITGEIQAGAPTLEGYTVQLYDIDHHSMVAVSDLHVDGQFQLLFAQ